MKGIRALLARDLNRFFNKELNVCKNRPCGSRSYSIEKNCVHSIYSDVQIPNVNLTKYIFEAQEKYASRIALINGDTDESFTHRECRSLSLTLASALSRLGVTKGDVVALVAPNCPEFIISFLGVSHLGAVVTPVNSTYTADEMLTQFNDANPTVVIVHQFLLPKIYEVTQSYKKLRHIIVMGNDDEASLGNDEITLRKLFKDDGKGIPSRVEMDPAEDLLVMPYSSGTTGLPKGVMLTHRNIIANLEQVLHPDLSRVCLDLDKPQPSFIGLLPFFHIYGMITLAMLGMCTGTKIITLSKFEPVQFMSIIDKHKPSYLHTVPPILAFLALTPEVKPSALTCVETVGCGAAPIGPSLLTNFLDKFDHGLDFVEGYGMTEASPVTHMTPKDNLIHGSCGKAVPNTLTKLVNVDTGETIEPGNGKKGELCIKGPQVMKGYHNNERATNQTISDGWLHTGDIARISEDGNVYIVDRLKELIKVKGLQVAPAELEDLLRKHPAVMDVAVIGVPDLRCGELPKAFIVPKKGHEVTAEEIASFVEKKVAIHKRLDGGVCFVDQIPKSQTGKVLRRLLKEELK